MALLQPFFHEKDNLFGVVRRARGERSTGGCTGFGCGAGFNFVAVAADGQIHACRKFPSPIGKTLEEAYFSPAARAYRAGAKGCQSCALAASCGGCLAVCYGRGGDPLRDRDPDCFKNG
jgi:radical SAM protein with 4Fe4S-binding SPASM domain